MSKQPQLADFKQIAKDHHLKFFVEGPLREPLLAIINLKVRSLSVVSREIFSQEQGIIWAEDVINVPAPRRQKKKSLYNKPRVSGKLCYKLITGWE